MRRVLFVCTGNICRSPMAEYLARATTAQPDIQYGSAGTHALAGQPPSEGAVTAMSELGIDISGHRSRSVWAVVDEADIVVAMAAEHAGLLRRGRPDRADDIIALRTDGGSVQDPYGGTIAEYRRARDEISAALDGRWT